jgi:RNA polymerase-binding transcription factor DksA
MINEKLKWHIAKRLENPRPLTSAEIDAVTYCEFADYEVERMSRVRFRNLAQIKASRLKREYNLSVQDYQRMFKEQAGVCAICGQEIKESDCHIDHDHKTGRVRGLLCGNCNKGLGMFRDDSSVLLNAIDYLK